MTAKIMSVWASGRYEIFPTPSPSPAPVKPPEPIPIVAWTIWKPAPWASLHGSRKLKMRARRYGSIQIAASPIPTASTDAASEQPDRHARDEEDREHHPAQRDRRPEIGLDDDEPAEDRGQQAEWLDELAEGPRRAPAREVDRREETERELRELGGLEARRPDDEPAPRPVDRRPGDEDRDTEDERREEERWRDEAEAVVVEARRERHEDDADQRVDGLALQVAHRVAVPERGRRRGRAVDHHEPERDEPERDERDETLIGVAVALHGSSSTRARNASPRASKSRNWSKLAHAGESRTTSPGDGSRCSGAERLVQRLREHVRDARVGQRGWRSRPPPRRSGRRGHRA